MDNRPRAHQRLLLAGLLLVLMGLALGKQAWASSLLSPQRQTVPLTPPATWTPEALATREPTKPQPPTPDDEQRQPAEGPRPWLGLSVGPQAMAPGMVSTLRVQLLNQGNGELADALVTMQLPRELVYAGGSMASGSLEHHAGSVLWAIRVAAQSESMLELQVRVGDDVLPDRRIELQAHLTWPGGVVSSNTGTLQLFLSLLP